MTKTYKISVIVPVYRAENYLERCVNSLTGQNYENMEIVLVDDGSPDRCPGMCDAYAASDERIRVVHKQNGGLMSAWQAGVRESGGEYLCFVDSDDWVETGMLAEMASYLTGSREEIICCNFVIDRTRRGKQSVTEHRHVLPPGVYEADRLEEVKDRLLGRENRTVSMSRCMKLFSRRLIEENMRYCDPRITMGEDVNITLPALLDCGRLVILKDAFFYHYFHNGDSIVHSYDAKMYEGIRALYRAVQEIFREKGRKNGEEQSAGEYVHLLLLAVKNELRGGGADYRERIREICRAKENESILKAYPVRLDDRAGRLVYFGMRHPGAAVLSALRLAFRMYDAR